MVRPRSLQELLESHRRSGRTQRMLAAAIAHAAAGEYVFVIGGSAEHCQQLLKRVETELSKEEIRLQVVHNSGTCKIYVGSEGGQISFHSAWEDQFDPAFGEMRGSHPACRVYADHRVFELLVGRLLGWCALQWDHWSCGELTDGISTEDD